MSVLEELEGTIHTAAERFGPAVIGLGQGWGRGSGFVIDSNRILTNAHNLRGDEVTVTFQDGRRETGRVLASDLDVDLAVIEADTGEIEPLQWAEEDLESLPIGRSVLALANPGGRGLRVTPGFVSSTARRFRGPRRHRIGFAIEHTAPLPRGSSGGPLLDRAGRLLGVNSIRTDGGLILAVPADGAIRERVEKLSRGEAPQRVRLGVAIAPPR
ncbi:MAG TPA: S1C family serine protease, partial [Solirubrobacteraceae bacterium]|nr:S1C family serine protease [Solirubrobacteraceae bacterium]